MKHHDLPVVEDADIELGVKHIAIDGYRHLYNRMEVKVNENGDSYLISGIEWKGRTWVFNDGKRLNDLKGVKNNLRECQKEERAETFLDYILFPLHDYDTKVEQVVLSDVNSKVFVIDFDYAYEEEGYLLIILNCEDKEIVKLYKYPYFPVVK